MFSRLVQALLLQSPTSVMWVRAALQPPAPKINTFQMQTHKKSLDFVFPASFQESLALWEHGGLVEIKFLGAMGCC